MTNNKMTKSNSSNSKKIITKKEKLDKFNITNYLSCILYVKSASSI